RHFLLLFDLTFSDPIAITRARAAAKQVLATLQPSDLVAVATYNAVQGPQLVVGFTPDRAQVAIGIDTLGLPQLFHPGSDPLRMVATQPAPSNPTSAGGPGAEARASVQDAQMLTALQSVTLVSSRGARNAEQQVV